MRIQTLFEGLKHVLNVGRSRYYSNRGRNEKARAWLDTALSLEDDPLLELIAYDATLMVVEGRHEEARDRYRECLAVLPELLSPNETYVSLFCKLRLAVYDENRHYEELEELWEQADNLGVGGVSKFLLPLGSKSVLLENCGHRIPLDRTFKLKDCPAKASRVFYRARF